MTFTRTRATILLAALAGAATVVLLHAQTAAPPQPSVPPTAAPASQVPQPPVRPTPPQPARAVIFLDPAHGGPETGASLGPNLTEKDAVLAFSQRLRPALASSGFSVVTTRENDLSAALPTDQRAEIANRTHALACIVIHATSGGSGVHLFTSTLAPASTSDSGTDTSTPFAPVPWESAQASFAEQSRKLSDILKATMTRSSLPVLTGSAPLRPLDNLMCPAIAVEIAPRTASNAPSGSAADADYQQQIVAAVVSALQAWRTQNTAVSPDLPGEAP